MTAQVSDQLNNQHITVDFGELSLYGIITGDVTGNHGWGNRYKYQNEPLIPKDNKMCSALWRGYIAEFKLAADGTLTLDSYRFPFAPGKPSQIVNERLMGNFWLVMKSQFEGNRVYVPFRDGVVVDDENNWVVEGKELLAALKHPVRKAEFEPKNIALDTPVFVGIISRVQFDEVLEDNPWVEFDRDIPSFHQWCEVQIRRDEVLISNSKICGSSGGASGPWLLSPPFDPMVQVGDQVYALAREPTDAEIEQQIAAGPS